MFINPNTEIPLCFTKILGTTVTIAFVNHVGFVDVFVLQIEKGLNFPCQPNYFEDTTKVYFSTFSQGKRSIL